MAQADIDELPRPRWWLKPLIALALLGVLVIAGVQIYRRFEPVRLAKQGRTYFAQGDYRNAVLCAQRALQINPLSDEGARLMVEITEQVGSPATLAWRQQIAALNPESKTDALALATTALQQFKPEIARAALDALPEGARGSAAFHEKAGLTALQGQDRKAAEAHLREATKLEPKNELHRYNLATLQIQSRDPAKRKEGAAILAEFAKGGRLRLFALRNLVARHKQDGELDLALLRSAELLGEKGATFRDQLVQLEFLRGGNRAEFEPSLERVQRLAASQPENASVLINWMRIEGLAKEALTWADTLGESVSSLPAVIRARAECLAATKDWSALQLLTSAAKWGRDEYLRSAWEARARRELGDDVLSTAAFQSALSAAARNRDDLQQLFALTSMWGWLAEKRETLWAAVDAPSPQWALQALHRSYLAEENTEGLLRIAQRTLQIDPRSAPARNNVAMLSILRGVDLPESLAASQMLAAEEPTNATFVTTYALALHASGQTSEALESMRRLPESSLKEPSVAAYFGVLLAANGRTAEAEPYLKIAAKAPLLPEERALLATIVKPTARD